MKEESGKNTAVPSEIQNRLFAIVIIKIGTMVKNIEAAQNTLPFPMSLCPTWIISASMPSFSSVFFNSVRTVKVQPFVLGLPFINNAFIYTSPIILKRLLFFKTFSKINDYITIFGLSFGI